MIRGFCISAAEIQKWKDGMHNGVKRRERGDSRENQRYYRRDLSPLLPCCMEQVYT